MSAVIEPREYPAVMDHKLRRVRRRQLGMAVARAIVIGAFALTVGMIAAMSLDWWLTLFNTGVRIGLTVGVVTAALVTLLAFGIRPIIGSLGLQQAADQTDRQLPQLEERWTTIASFAESREQPTDATTRAMLHQVTSEAVAMGTLVDPTRVVQPRSLRKPLLALAAALVVLAGFLGVNWTQNRVLFQRFWSPTAPISATIIASQTGDSVLPRGDSIELEFAQSGLVRETALLTLATEDGVNETISLDADTDLASAFGYRVASVDNSFRYQIRAGDGQTQWHTVTVVDRPALAEVRLTLTAPDYVDRPPYEKSYLPDRVRAIEGSRLTLVMRPETPLERLDLQMTSETTVDGEEPVQDINTVTIAADADGWYRFETTLHEDFSLSPVLIGSHELTNDDRPECRIRVIPDKAPVAHVISPLDEIAVDADAVVEIKFEAHDDHGVAMAELIVYDNSKTADGEEPEVLSIEQIPLGDQQMQKHVMATTRLDLSQFNLLDGADISYAIRVTDNRSDLSSNAQTTAKPEVGDNPSADQQNGNGLESDGIGAESTESETDGDDSARKELSAVERPADSNSTPDDGSDNPDELPGAKNSSAANPGTTSPESDSTTNEPASPSTAPQGAAARSSENSDDASPDADGTPAQPTENAAAAKAADAPSDNAASDAGSDTGEADSEKTGTPSENENDPESDNAANAGSSGPRTADGSEQDEESGEDPPPAGSSLSTSMAGQFTESNRLRLKVSRTLTSAGGGDGGNEDKPDGMEPGEWVELLDKRLAAAESTLTTIEDELNESSVTDAQVTELIGVDTQLADVEQIIGKVRESTKETQFAFAGLQLVQIGRSHVTPARDRVFVLIRQPGADFRANVSEALQRVTRARELLGNLVKQIEKIERDEKLADNLDEAVEMYRVYIEKVQRLMREARENRNPLKRKMEVVEVDQAYLDRLREVLNMRGEMMEEFGRILADDPRLLSKYMDIIRRRNTSLRDDLSRLHEEQADLTEEVVQWNQIDPERREDVWLLASELRLYEAAPMARDASQLEERTAAQMPLGLDLTYGPPRRLLEHSKQIAVRARSIASKARRRIRQPFDDDFDVLAELAEVAWHISEFDTALEELELASDDEDTADFVTRRLAENRALADRVLAWSESAGSIQNAKYHSLAKVDQQELAQRTEVLRAQMLDIGDQLNNQFADDVPQPILNVVAELQQVVEGVTFNQIAATYSLDADQLGRAEPQVVFAAEGFARAEELFDQMRRMVVEEVDKEDPDDPNIADLEDPTLDEFLQRLEREPDLIALLGLGRRPRNLKIMSDWMLWNDESQDGIAGAMGESARKAKQRAEEEREKAKRNPPMDDEERDPTEEEWQQIANAEEAQERLDDKIQELKKQAEDPGTDEAEAEELRQMAKQLEQLRNEIANRDIDNKEWREMARSDQMRAVMRAMANGDPLPDTQWNNLMSSLDKGLWQVRRRIPPEDHRAAIQQYQEQIRRLLNLETSDDE